MGWLDEALRTALLQERLRQVPQRIVSRDEALPGRAEKMPVAEHNIVTGKTMQGPFPEQMEQIVLGLGCFWGAEKYLWELDGVWTTAVGYAGGWTDNPTYEETCTGRTGHTEAVLVVYDPAVISTRELLARFFEAHDPTTANRQGNDVGTQYRSAVYATTPQQLDDAKAVQAQYQRDLGANGYGEISTEIGMLDEVRGGRFYYAEDYHQQYLVKVPNGYCPVHATGVKCGPVAQQPED